MSRSEGERSSRRNFTIDFLGETLEEWRSWTVGIWLGWSFGGWFGGLLGVFGSDMGSWALEIFVELIGFSGVGIGNFCAFHINFFCTYSGYGFSMLECQSVIIDFILGLNRNM